MPNPFLSAEWIAEARVIRAKYEDQAPKIPISIRMNQVITKVPFGDGTINSHLDTSSGELVMELGHLETPDLTVTTDYATARHIFLERDPQAGRGQAGIRLRRFHEACDAQVGQRGDGLGRGLGVGQRVEGGLEAPFGAGGGHPDARPRLADESEHLVVRSAADGDGACLEIGDLEDLVHAVGLRLGLERGHQGVLILTFGGGTNELQRDLIAMFGLGFPRSAR